MHIHLSYWMCRPAATWTGHVRCDKDRNKEIRKRKKKQTHPSDIVNHSAASIFISPTDVHCLLLSFYSLTHTWPSSPYTSLLLCLSLFLSFPLQCLMCSLFSLSSIQQLLSLRKRHSAIRNYLHLIRGQWTLHTLINSSPSHRICWELFV